MTRIARVATALGTVAVRVEGAGPAVLLLHANPGDSRDYQAVAPRLAERFTVYAVDWPGYGRSPVPADPRSVTAMSYAAILPELLAGLGVARAAVIGNSVGGYAAARLAVTRPAMVTAVILANSSGFSGHDPLSHAVTRIKGTEMVTGARWRAGFPGCTCGAAPRPSTR